MKYSIYKATAENGNKKIIAVSHFNRQPVRAVAICSENDTYDEEVGTNLAVARVNYRVEEKRVAATRAYSIECFEKFKAAEDAYRRSQDKLVDAEARYEAAVKALDDLEASLDK